MTKKDKVVAMFKNGNEWKRGIKNGLTYRQILHKLGIDTKNQTLYWDERHKLCTTISSVRGEVNKAGLWMYSLPFGRKHTRIFFIPETNEEQRRCIYDAKVNLQKRKDNYKERTQDFFIAWGKISEGKEEDKKVISKCWEEHQETLIMFDKEINRLGGELLKTYKEV